MVTDANGCESLTKDDVVITVSKPAKLNAGPDDSVAINQPLQLFASDVNNTGFINYTWSPASGLNNPFIPNPVATLSDPKTLLIVTASTASNCIGIDSIIVYTFKGPEIYVPNTFTPNGDWNNDVLRAIPIGMKSFTYFRIFNRFGELVFSTTNPNIGWDGKLKGYVQNMGTFVWIAAAIDYKGNLIQRKGTTTIIQ
jgi:gliding motility-associated-like protein